MARPICSGKAHDIADDLLDSRSTAHATHSVVQMIRQLVYQEEIATHKEHLFERIKDVHTMGITILLTEQDISYAFDISGRNYVMSKGKILATGSADDLLADELIRKTYLGL
jgi:ABC-type branched-subunit amino acid transport system ATPase component